MVITKDGTFVLLYLNANIFLTTPMRIFRDALVAAATNPSGTSHDFVKYKTVEADQTGLIPNGTFFDNLPINHGIPQDGIVKMLTVTIQ